MTTTPRLVQWSMPIVTAAKPSLDAILTQAQTHRNHGDVEPAHATLVRAARNWPKDHRPYLALGQLAEATGQLGNALACYDQALVLQPQNPETMLAKASVLAKLAKFADARQCVQQVLSIDANHPDALVFLAALDHHAGDLSNAEVLIERVLASSPAHAGAWNTRGKLLLAKQDRAAALAAFQQATYSGPNHAEAWVNLGVTMLATGGERDQALDFYRQALQIDPLQPDAHFNLGSALFADRAYKKASEHLQRNIAVCPTNVQAYINLAFGLHAAMQCDPAVQVAERGLQACGSVPALWAQKAESLAQLGRHRSAIDAANMAIQLGHTASSLKAQLPSWHRNLCDWAAQGCSFQDWRASLNQDVALNPFIALSIDDDAAIQKQIAQRATACLPVSTFSKATAIPVHGRKLRIGYLSPDFRKHPIMTILADVFESHDREHFEWFAFSLIAVEADPVQTRAKASFDHFLDVSEWSDERIANHARDLGIDVMVDLAGHTSGSRMAALALRCAPVQVTYIGYPGTTAIPAIDYILGSAVVTPAGSEAWFTECPVQLPWLVPISPRPMSDRHWTRAEVGLPDDAFVFCSFNNNYKFTPEMFSAWVRIVQQVEGSVLWLYAKTPEVEANLRQEALTLGLDPTRLIFAGTVPLPDYIARMRLADLFLDTNPYNAHTTALDAIWAGLPVLTFTGSSFVSRMAAGVLSSIGLSELVASSLNDYESRAVAFGLKRQRTNMLREQLLSLETRSSKPYDSTVFARLLEQAFRAMANRAVSGQPPAPLEIDVHGQAKFGPLVT